MFQLNNINDTIAAISTSLGQGAIGIVRLSGGQALIIADAMFITKNRSRPSQFKNFTIHYGWVTKKNKDGQEEQIDEALLTVMRAPQSYTKEDVVEISCHGGMVSLRAILSLALDLGARLAEPGEFTKRAYLNGRIDLAQAEAVLDIIQSKTDTFLRISTNQLKGELSTELEAIREILLNVYVALEALVNFPEDVPAGTTVTEGLPLQQKVNAALNRVDKLLATSHQGRILKEGIKIVICGRVNVGKSSLLNVLLKTPRAIVCAIAGTTRDTIEETAEIQGIPFQLVDTAGILKPRDFIEEEAVKRSQMSIQGADLVLLLVDAGAPLTEEDKKLMNDVKDQSALVVFNKCDLPLKASENEVREILPAKEIVRISALEKTGIEQLESRIAGQVLKGGASQSMEGILLSNVRHIEALKKCQEALNHAQEAFRDGLSWEFVSEEIKFAVHHLDTITGRDIGTDLLQTIFSQFCIGK